MTALLERPGTKSKAKGGASIVGTTLPQVNLLPPEVRAARGLRRTKRMLLFVLVGAVALCVLAWVFSLFEASSAQSDLDGANADKDALMEQLADPKYAEVPLVLSALDANRAALPLAMATDVIWSDYIDAIAAVLPEGASIDTFTVTYATPMSGAPLPGDPLQAPSLGQIAFTGRSVTVPETAAWLKALNSIPGFQDAWLASAAVTSEDSGDGAGDGEEYYTFSSTVQVSDTKLTHRFDGTKSDAPADTSASDDESTED
ncbi:PilN domain-containing protein [Cellulomonas gilvus]|uniref:Fimbrial assembly family protein n=1 Tax=Cellulomonas gilvus (strain ATCC 13127 / NRRL B-14078) TaxID=593907 RepID=F8A6V4_CELGA|nr:fimbrial assembly family protein [Cellulomonas gilvus]AEI12308.1 Fimbrial assembly family protein [Cellulomonas gilvus ATCC 13127]